MAVSFQSILIVFMQKKKFWLIERTFGWIQIIAELETIEGRSSDSNNNVNGSNDVNVANVSNDNSTSYS